MAGELDWDASDTALVNAASVTDGSTNTSAAVDQDSKSASEVVVSAAYASGSPTEGLKVYLLRVADGSNYQDIDDDPVLLTEMPYAGSATRQFTVTVYAEDMRAFKVYCTNDSGVTVTLDIDYRQAVRA